MTGVINLYKPKGITSSDAVVRTKRILHTRAVGHMGTLDPQGEGVLILGVGKATRLFDYFLGKDKVYEAEFTFGHETDTLDGEGVVIHDGGVVPSIKDISEKIKSFIGRQMQYPPKYSAKKVSGRKAYDMARSGEQFELKPCEIEIFDFEPIDLIGSKLTVRIHCSSGTYIRSICRDLAHSLDTYAVMTAIKRTRCGNFDISESVALDELTEEKLIPVEKALCGLEDLILPDGYYKDICNGRKIKLDRDGRFLVF